jgi:DNA relaxase NicK
MKKRGVYFVDMENRTVMSSKLSKVNPCPHVFSFFLLFEEAKGFTEEILATNIFKVWQQYYHSSSN